MSFGPGPFPNDAELSLFWDVFRAKPQKLGLLRVKAQREPLQLRRLPPPRATPGPLRPRAPPKPARHKVGEPEPVAAAPRLGEARDKRPGGSWTFPPLRLPLLQLQDPLHPRGRLPVFCGWTSIVRVP